MQKKHQQLSNMYCLDILSIVLLIIYYTVYVYVYIYIYIYIYTHTYRGIYIIPDTAAQKFGISKIFYAHQGCIYLIKNTDFFLILWNIIAICNIGFLF